MAERYTSAMLREVKGKDGKRRAWKGVLKYKDANGKWKQTAKTFGAEVRTKSQAQKALSEWHSEMEKSATRDNLPSSNTAVAEYVSTYIDTLEAAGTVRPSAISDYRTSCKRISEGIGDVILRDLTPAKIQAWEAKLLKDGRGVNTVLKYHRLLNSVCKHAINVRDLDWNPCTAVKKPKRVAPSPNSLTAEQHARLNVTLDALGATPTVTAVTIALYTGMREGEVCALKWKCYDEQSGTIRIEKAVAKAGGKKYVTDPKTEASKRDIPVHPALASTLRRRRESMVAELRVAGMILSDKDFGELYVCGTTDGRYLDPTILSRSWKALAESFELIGTQGRRVTFHDLRHSFATRAIAEGADVKAVAAVLGHSDAHVTLNVYADADKESKARAVALVGYGIQQQGDVKPYAELAPTSD